MPYEIFIQDPDREVGVPIILNEFTFSITADHYIWEAADKLFDEWESQTGYRPQVYSGQRRNLRNYDITTTPQIIGYAPLPNYDTRRLGLAHVYIRETP